MQPFISPRGAWALGDREFGTGVCGAKGLLSRSREERGATSIFFSVHAIAGLFVFSDRGMGPRRWSEPSNQKLLENPNPEHVAEPALDSVDKVALSLCGGLAETRDIPLGMFKPWCQPS